MAVADVEHAIMETGSVQGEPDLFMIQKELVIAKASRMGLTSPVGYAIQHQIS